MNNVSTATVEVPPEGKKIVDLFPFSLAVPAYAVFTVANIRHPNSRSAYLETIYWCVSQGAKDKMLNKDGVFRRGNRQLFTAEHVWWMHIIHEALRSQRPLEEGKQSSHELIRQKALYEDWTWRDFASALQLNKETLKRFYATTKKILFTAQRIYEQQQQSTTQASDSSRKSQCSSRRRRSPSTKSSYGGIADFF
jgi:hypothetical protein